MIAIGNVVSTLNWIQPVQFALFGFFGKFLYFKGEAYMIKGSILDESSPLSH